MKRILFILVVAQFLCTSLWFAGNAINSELTKDLSLAPQFLGHLTTAVQLGFIAGTLVFAILTISDRFSPSLVFFVSSVLAGLFNLGITLSEIHVSQILTFRFFTGFFLAGIYPVGMLIASHYYQNGLGKSLGLLVGALVVGTAFPHLLRDLVSGFPWRYVLYATSGLSLAGGVAVVFLIPDGPHRRPGSKLDFTALLKGFRHARFRSASFGYFGHMWELYAFWAFVPVMLTAYKSHFSISNLNVALYSFLLIASGGFSCVLGGFLSQRLGVKRVAIASLFLSCLCCLLSPLFLFNSSTILFVSFLFCWSLFVVADSPLFSTLVAQNAPPDSRGTALTIVNSIGFSITIISIQLVNLLSDKIAPQYIYISLSIGPILGLLALRDKDGSYSSE